MQSSLWMTGAAFEGPLLLPVTAVAWSWLLTHKEQEWVQGQAGQATPTQGTDLGAVSDAETGRSLTTPTRGAGLGAGWSGTGATHTVCKSEIVLGHAKIMLTHMA